MGGTIGLHRHRKKRQQATRRERSTPSSISIRDEGKRARRDFNGHRACWVEVVSYARSPRFCNSSYKLQGLQGTSDVQEVFRKVRTGRIYEAMTGHQEPRSTTWTGSACPYGMLSVLAMHIRYVAYVACIERSSRSTFTDLTDLSCTTAAFQIRVMNLLTPTKIDIRLFLNVISTGSGQRILRPTPSWVQVGGHSSAQLRD